MKAHALVPALALAAALLAPSFAEAGHGRRSSRGHRPPAHYYDRGHRHGYGGYGGYGYSYGHRSYRPYYRSYRYAPYGGYYAPYDYGYSYGYWAPPPPPRRYCRPRSGFYFGFRF